MRPAHRADPMQRSHLASRIHRETVGVVGLASQKEKLLSDPEQVSLREIAVDRDNLYREEIYTDLKVATIRCMVPIQSDGSPDPSRPVLYSGQTTLMSQAGPLPVQCPLDAQTLEEAIEQFPDGVAAAVDRMVEEARELQRQEASRIVVPGQSMPGKIQL